MSSPRALILLTVVLALSPGRFVRAQLRASETESLLQRVRVLDSVMLARGYAVDSIRRAFVRPVPPVDIRQGPIHVRTDSSLAPQVQGAVATVVALIERRGGTWVAARTSARVPTITRDSTRSIIGMLPTIAINADTTSRWSAIGQRSVRARSSVAELANSLAGIVEQLAMQGVDSTLTAWVMVGRAPLRPASETEAVDAYIEIATTESIVLRRCRARDVSACLDALGIDSMPGSRLDRWYAPEDFRSLLRVAAPPREDSVAVVAWMRCRQVGDDADCGVAARALANARVPLPLSAAVRFEFLREVLDAGGAGAFDRLVTSPGTVKDRLSAAAREPLDRTVLRWLDRIEGSRPERMRIPAVLVAGTLGWTGLILALAVIRRTPWA